MSLNDGAAYLQSHKIPSTLDTILKELVETTPEEPYEVMMARLLELSGGRQILRGMNFVVPYWSNPHLRVCIVGDSGVAHVMLAYFSSRGIYTTALVGSVEDASVMSAASVNGIRCTFTNQEMEDAGLGEVCGRPAIITNKPQEVIPFSNVIILPVPSYVYVEVLCRIQPFIAPGTLIIATPGLGGFDYITKSVLAKCGDDVMLCSLYPQPFYSVLNDYGKDVTCENFDHDLTVFLDPAYTQPTVFHIVKLLFGNIPNVADNYTYCGPIMNATLLPLGPCVHPVHVYRLLQQGPLLKNNPNFYETMDKESGDLMKALSLELGKIALSYAIAMKQDIKSQPIFDFEYANYPNQECSTIDELYSCNPLYQGIKGPFKPVIHEGVTLFEVDVKHRYLSEDVPYGLCLWRGLAELAKIDTPILEKIILFLQGLMKKQYLAVAEGSTSPAMIGRDVMETTAPQRFGITTFEAYVLLGVS